MQRDSVLLIVLAQHRLMIYERKRKIIPTLKGRDYFTLTKELSKTNGQNFHTAVIDELHDYHKPNMAGFNEWLKQCKPKGDVRLMITDHHCSECGFVGETVIESLGKIECPGGHAGGGYVTPYKLSIDRVKEFLGGYHTRKTDGWASIGNIGTLRNALFFSQSVFSCCNEGLGK
jgi:hypothetical protein